MTNVPIYCQHKVVLVLVPGPVPAPGEATAAWLNEHLPMDLYSRLAQEKCELCAVIFKEHGENTHVEVIKEIDGQHKNWLFPEA